MDNSYVLVSSQIYILMLGGVWPIWKRPFFHCKAVNIFLLVYSCFMCCFWAVQMLKRCYVLVKHRDLLRTSGFFENLINRLLQALLQVAILHLAIFKHQNVITLSRTLNKLSRERNRLFVYGALACLVGFNFVLTYSFIEPFFSSYEKAFEGMRSNSFTGRNIEVIILIVLQLITIIFSAMCIPTSLVFGHCLAVLNEFNLLKSQFSRIVDSSEIHSSDNTRLKTLKDGFYEIGEFVNGIQDTFFCYILTFSLAVAVDTVNLIYYAECVSSFVIVLMMLSRLFGLALPCAGGSIVSNRVSQFQRHSVGDEFPQRNFLTIQTRMFGSIRRALLPK